MGRTTLKATFTAIEIDCLLELLLATSKGSFEAISYFFIDVKIVSERIMVMFI